MTSTRVLRSIPAACALLIAGVGCSPSVAPGQWDAPDAAGMTPAGSGGNPAGQGNSGGSPGMGTGGQGTGGAGESPSGGSGGATASGGSMGTGGDTGTGGGAATGGGASGGASAGGGPGSNGTGGRASGGGSGPVGGSSGTAGTAGGADCPAGSFLCEGFEAYAASAAPGGAWTKDVRGAGAVTVDTSRAFSGSKALHVTGSTNADRANVLTPLSIPSSARTVFVRFMMYTVSYPSSSGVHTRLIRLGTMAAASGDPDSSYSFASYNGTAIEKVNSIYLRSTATHLNDAANKNKWTCWEFEIDSTGGVGKVTPHIWLEGRELSLAVAGSSSHGMTSTSWDPIPFELFIMGVDGFQADAVKGDFWIDDLRISPQRVGCPVR